MTACLTTSFIAWISIFRKLLIQIWLKIRRNIQRISRIFDHICIKRFPKAKFQVIEEVVKHAPGSNFFLKFFRFCNLPIFLLGSLSGCIHAPTPDEQMWHIEQATGLRPEPDGESPEPALTKIHDGYPVMVRFKMGNVWGRWATRVAVGEIGREVGGILGFLTGQTKSGVGTITGSPFDRVLSQAIGQPLSIVAVLRHGKPGASRLDLYNESSRIQPYDPLPSVEWISMSAGTLYSVDTLFARRILDNSRLIKILENLRSGYVRVDEYAVSFLFAGSENDYSGMIRNFGSYENMLNGILDGLAGIANEI